MANRASASGWAISAIEANIVMPEEAGTEMKEVLAGLRIEMRTMHRNIAVELDAMRKMQQTAQRRRFGWLIGIMLGGMAGSAAAERDFIRRELDMLFSTLPRVADGFQPSITVAFS
jgi:hypothetical protein